MKVWMCEACDSRYSELASGEILGFEAKLDDPTRVLTLDRYFVAP